MCKSFKKRLLTFNYLLHRLDKTGSEDKIYFNQS